MFGSLNQSGAGSDFGIWLPAIEPGMSRELSPDIRSGIEDHVNEIQTEEDMERVIHQLYLRR
mgnify:CR=1 FL=1